MSEAVTIDVDQAVEVERIAGIPIHRGDEIGMEATGTTDSIGATSLAPDFRGPSTAFLFRTDPLWVPMPDDELLNEWKCEECGQVTMTRHWQDITFCANCGVEVDSTEADRQEHLSLGIALTPDEVEQLVDGEEICLTRSVTNDHHLTINLMKAPP